MKTQWRLFFTAGIAGLVLSGWLASEAPAQNGKTKTAYILYSSSSHGYFDPCG